MELEVVFGQMLVLLVMMLIGYYVYKKGRMSENASGQLSSLVANVFNPMLVLTGVMGENAAAEKGTLLLNFGMVCLYFAILILFSHLMPRLLRVEKKVKTTVRIMTLFANTGFMGIPVIRSIYGNDAIIYVTFYMLVYNLILYTYGLRLAERTAVEYRGIETSGNWKDNLKRILNPGVVAAVIAMIIFAVDLPIPEPVCTFCDYMGNATIPLSMLLIGMSVAQENLKEVISDIRIYLFILLRMVALPIIMAFLLKPVVGDATVLGVFILELGMPVGSIVAMLIQEKGGNYKYCTKAIVMSTLCSIVTIPVISLFL